jgi:large subunit ribosomal protein L22
MLTKAVAYYIRVSPTKARLIADLIRGKSVAEALSILRFSPQAAARLIEKVLRSAIANAQQREGGSDVDRRYVSACFANQGPSMKRIRPAPMGRAFRVIKRMAHLTVAVDERPMKVSAAPPAAAKRSGAKKSGRRPATRAVAKKG